jgi:hypothetical protein
MYAHCPFGFISRNQYCPRGVSDHVDRTERQTELRHQANTLLSQIRWEIGRLGDCRSPLVVSDTRIVDSRENGGPRHAHTFADDPPMPANEFACSFTEVISATESV